MNRQLKTKLPVSSELLKPEVVKLKEKELVEREKSQKFYYDKKSSMPLPEVSLGEIVRIVCIFGNWKIIIKLSFLFLKHIFTSFQNMSTFLRYSLSFSDLNMKERSP
jgi:hypothetical protein